MCARAGLFLGFRLLSRSGGSRCICIYARAIGQWIRYMAVAAIALFLVWWLLRLHVL
jgi:hypothetical protein